MQHFKAVKRHAVWSGGVESKEKGKDEKGRESEKGGEAAWRGASAFWPCLLSALAQHVLGLGIAVGGASLDLDDSGQLAGMLGAVAEVSV